MGLSGIAAIIPRRFRNAAKTAICTCAPSLPHWMKWRRVQYGYELRAWYRRIVLLR